MAERAKDSNIQTTECVKTQFPRQNFQDALIVLNIGSAFEFASVLFPKSFIKFLSQTIVPTTSLQINSTVPETSKTAYSFLQRPPAH
jgi:hypothetical protein